MREEIRCPNCFKGSIASGKCPVCGFDRQEGKSNPMGLPEGHQLDGRYLIGRILGFGGFGITYKAYDLFNQCCCAVKEFVPTGVTVREEDGIQVRVVTNSRLGEYEHGKKRFLEEAEVLKKLTDVPEVVQITDYFTQNNTVYFVMEYIEGATLKQLMESFGGRVPLREAMSIIYYAGEALDQVHRRTGIFHRDISPDNIMVNQRGRVKLIDFGNAKYMIGKKSQNLSVVLKHGYAPPEQYSSTSKQGSYTDVYSLAATFYYVVTGVRVPNAPDRFGGEEYRPLKEMDPNAGDKVSAAVDRALILNCKHRTQTTAEFVREFPLLSTQQEAPSLKTVDVSAKQDVPFLKPADVSTKQEVPFLKLADGSGRQEWRLPQNAIIGIGRSGELSDIVPTKNGMVSKKHCELFYDSIEKCFYLVDQSTNGTFVGNMRLKKGETYILKAGERFFFGNHICDLEVGIKNG